METDLFAGAQTVAVTQTKEWLEIFTGIEQRNRFSVDFGGKSGALLAAEETSGWMRFFLGSMRTYTVSIYTRDKKKVLGLHAPFKWIRRVMTVSAPDGRALGTVRKRLTFPHTRYDVFDAHERPVFEIVRGLLKAWTFTIQRDGREAAVIRKRWSGTATELFTDADRFQLEFVRVTDPEERALLLGALFFIDLMHFEKSGND